METTLNVHDTILEIVNREADAAGVSRSKMIITLIKLAMDDIENAGRMGTMVRYQQRAEKEEWHRLHVSLRIDDYEYFLDLRKLLKMSISLILAYAVKRFVGKMRNKRITDNYQCKNYIIMREVIDNVICWKFYWGFPPDPAKLL
ncbi:MAG: hypothetical protein JW807_04700 [Spirochaetes bacterium]|nr:hypothetical protein [Spirochaetota bacterium]